MCGKNPLWEHHKHFLAHTALRLAHNPNQVSTATGAPSLPTVWVSPDPCTPLGVSSTSSFGLWVLDSPSRVWLHCLAFPAVPLGTPKSLSLWQSMDVVSGEMPGAQLQFSSSWSLHTGQQYHSSRGCSGSWGCTLWLLKGDFGETSEVGFRGSNWSHFQHNFCIADYNPWDDKFQTQQVVYITIGIKCRRNAWEIISNRVYQENCFSFSKYKR